MSENKLKAKFENGEVALGPFVNINSGAMIEIDNRLRKVLNRVLSTRPHFHRTVVGNGKRSDEKDFKIGG